MITTLHRDLLNWIVIVNEPICTGHHVLPAAPMGRW
jgi:hypothetical protein